MTKTSDLKQKITLMKDNSSGEFGATSLSRAKFVPVAAVRASVSRNISGSNEFKITFKNMNFKDHISAVSLDDKILSIKKQNTDDRYIDVVAEE